MSAASGLRSALPAFAALCVIAGCGSRPSYWNSPVNVTTTVGLPSGVALVDDTDHRVVVLTADADLNLTPSSYPIGPSVATTKTSADGSTLFVLSAGDTNPTNAQEGPSLTTIQVNPTTSKVTAQQYPMSQPYGNLAVDPLGHWAMAYAQTGARPEPERARHLRPHVAAGERDAANPIRSRTRCKASGEPTATHLHPSAARRSGVGPGRAGGSVNGIATTRDPDPN